MGEPEYLPDIWKRGFVQSFSKESLLAQYGPQKEYRKEAWSPEKQSRFAEFRKQWKALEREGWEQGFLRREPCYECGGEAVVRKAKDAFDWVEVTDER